MKKICTHVVLCGLLSSSLVLIGMEEQQKREQLSKSNSGQNFPRAELSDGEETVGEKVLDHFKKVDKAVHGVIQGTLEGVEHNQKLIAKVMVTAGMSKQDAQNMTEEVIEFTGLVKEADKDLYAILQGIGESHDSLKKSQDADIKS